ncbi:hypothetical protein [Tunturibacter empetritectus]|uniref:Uncharacterized protein n=1 Tax=Tunturiibacter lichenicola TaxID=2051959 RepID=A0A7W8J4V8_9BACT|nr:hypothetical protein [Edaphobacter lichenicola]MBB5342637.1 hypothetical protein [Edaphobacter lichenicola]
MSVVLSVLATLIVDRHIKHEASDTVRARNIELVDDEGNLRGAFRLQGKYGKGLPELVLFDDHGDSSAALYSTGLSFAIPESASGLGRGRLSLGHLVLDDTDPHSDSMVGWGLVITNDNHTSAMLGISNTGKRWSTPAP